MHRLELSEIVDLWPEVSSCTHSVREIAARAYVEGMVRNDVEIRPEHMLFGLLRLTRDCNRCLASRTLIALKLDLRLFHLGLEKLTQRFGDMCTRGPIPNDETVRLLACAVDNSRLIGEFSISNSGCGSGGLLLAFLIPLTLSRTKRLHWAGALNLTKSFARSKT